ncbi:hypothetical protein ACS3QZ_12605 [Shimia sp. W99]
MTSLPLPARRDILLLWVAIACNLLVVTMVNQQIYTSRWAFAELRPDYIAHSPPTISRALEEPSVGDPFAIWMLICAPALFLSILLFTSYFRNRLARQPGVDPRQLKWITVFSIATVGLQALASTGMIMLSQFRFPDHHEMHMVGSYLFFFSQAGVVFVGSHLSNLHDGVDGAQRVLPRSSCRFRRYYVLVPYALSVVYLGLFIVKGIDLSPWNDALYMAYVTTELILISSFLFFLLSWVSDCLVTLGVYRPS